MKQTNTNTVTRFTLGMALLVQLGWVQSAQATKGQIGYFEDKCPNGWEEYKPLAGRVIVGAGKYIGYSRDKRNESKEYKPGEKSGEVEHKLTVQEMPAHSHKIPAHSGFSSHSGSSRRLDLNNNYSGTDPAVRGYGDETTLAGGNQPHNIMQPYLVLMPCIKTMDDMNNDDQEDQKGNANNAIASNAVNPSELAKTNKRIKKLRNFVMKLALKSGYEIEEAQKVYDSE